jgi:phospholipid/cholesterol/gamma-HCH transport system substrate-binding protein
VRWLSRVVTFVLLVALILGAAALMRSKMPETSVGQHFKTCALFRDGSKISTGSPVLIAGVRIGEVSGLTIHGDHARIEMILRDDTQVAVDSWVTKRAFSPFGDSYIEILPGGSDEGAATVRMLRSGECLMRVAEGASTDRLLRVLTRSMPKMEDGLERLSEVSDYGRKWAIATLQDNLLDAERWLDQGKIESPLLKADQALARLENATVNAAVAVHEATPNVLRTMDRITNGVSTARRQMAQTKVDLASGLQNAREGLDGADKTIEDLTEVVASVNEGRGSGAAGALGSLINDSEMADKIEDGIDTTREGVGAFTRFKSWLGLRFEFNIFSLQPRFFVTAEIRARTDKFYLVELERGPLGDFPDDQISDATGVPGYQRRQVIKDGVRFTAQFGKTFGNWFQIRGGIKESTFGFGSDLLLGKGRLKISGDLYGSVWKTPRLKLTGALQVARSIFIIAGVDDALNEAKYLNIRSGNSEVPKQFDEIRYGRDYFLGGTLHFTDADLAVLIRVYGALLVGLL